METITKTGYPNDDKELGESIAKDIASATIEVIRGAHWPCIIETPTKEMAALVATAIIKREMDVKEFSAKDWHQQGDNWIIKFDWESPDMWIGSIIAVNVNPRPSRDNLPEMVTP